MSAPPSSDPAANALDEDWLVEIGSGSADASSAAQQLPDDFAEFQDVDLLSELLLEEDAELELPVKRGRSAESKARRRVQQAISARRRRQSKKVEMDTLRDEQRFLSEYLETLLDKQNGVCAGFLPLTWQEAAKGELLKLKEAAVINSKIRQEIYRHNGFVRSCKSVIPASMPYRADLNMHSLLHTATDLPDDLQARTRYFDVVCTDAKLDLAKEILLCETKSTRPFTTPSFTWEVQNLGSSGFGITSVAVYALDTANACEIFQAARNAIVNCSVIWPNYSLMGSSVQQMELLSTKFKIRYSVSEHRFQSGTSGEQVFLESRDISYGRASATDSVLL